MNFSRTTFNRNANIEHSWQFKWVRTDELISGYTSSVVAYNRIVFDTHKISQYVIHVSNLRCAMKSEVIFSIFACCCCCCLLFFTSVGHIHFMHCACACVCVKFPIHIIEIWNSLNMNTCERYRNWAKTLTATSTWFLKFAFVGTYHRNGEKKIILIRTLLKNFYVGAVKRSISAKNRNEKKNKINTFEMNESLQAILGRYMRAKAFCVHICGAYETNNFSFRLHWTIHVPLSKRFCNGIETAQAKLHRHIDTNTSSWYEISIYSITHKIAAAPNTQLH